MDNERDQKVWDQIEKIFVNVLGPEAKGLKKETSARDISSWDSLTHVQLIMEVENFYKIRFALGELEIMQNVGDLHKAVLERAKLG